MDLQIDEEKLTGLVPIDNRRMVERASGTDG
jgi:hypothetical protein